MERGAGRDIYPAGLAAVQAATEVSEPLLAGVRQPG